MAEYIEREALIDNLNHFAPEHYNALINMLIEKQPAADVVEVKHGNWSIRCETQHDTHTGETDEEFYLECSECKRKEWDVSQDAILMGDYRKAIADFPYCHCGAKMDGERRSE